MDDFIAALASRPQGVSEEFKQQAQDGPKSAYAPTDQDGFSFLDVLDIINPLQHIPVISTLYREATGDTIGNFARVAGGALFGGPVGAASAAVDAVVQNLSGKDIGEHVYAFLNEGDRPPEADFQTAGGGFEPQTPGSLSVVGVTRENLAPPPPAAVAAVPAEGSGDPVQAWAQASLDERGRQVMGGAEAATEDPVTLWARQEQVIRTAVSRRDGAPGNEPVADQVRQGSKKVAGLTPDAGVMAALQMSGQETDPGAAGYRESQDLARQGSQDRAAEAAAGLAEMGAYRWVDLLAQARNPSMTMDG